MLGVLLLTCRCCCYYCGCAAPEPEPGCCMVLDTHTNWVDSGEAHGMLGVLCCRGWNALRLHPAGQPVCDVCELWGFVVTK